MVRPPTPLLLLDNALDDLLIFGYILEEHLFNPVLRSVTVAAPRLPILLIGYTCRENAHDKLLPSRCHILQGLLEFRGLCHLNDLQLLRCQV